MAGNWAGSHGTHRRTALVAGLATTAVLSASAVSFAAWTITTASQSFSVLSPSIPQMEPPYIVPGPTIAIGWTAVRLSNGAPTHRYRVTRHRGADSQVVCDVSFDRTSCADLNAPAASRVTYTVAATHGLYWIGPDSEASAPIDTPGDATAPRSPVARPTVSRSAVPAAPPIGDGAAVDEPQSPPSPTATVEKLAPTIAPDHDPNIEESPSAMQPAERGRVDNLLNAPEEPQVAG